MRKFSVYICLMLLIAALGNLFWPDESLEKISKSRPPRLSLNGIEKLKPRVYRPKAPLEALTKSAETYLTTDGVLRWTNLHRARSGLPSLKPSSHLDRVAYAKMADMFENNYFDHVSPKGVGPAELAKNQGYQFILVGENLARGNFGSDKKLVQAWMDSPGHRDNILKPEYLELGIAVGQGEIKGKRTWISVQSFGVSSSACPKEFNLDHIKDRSAELQAREEELAEERELIETNEQAERFNQELQIFREEVDALNAEKTYQNQLVKAYNDCIQSFTATH